MNVNFISVFEGKFASFGGFERNFGRKTCLNPQFNAFSSDGHDPQLSFNNQQVTEITGLQGTLPTHYADYSDLFQKNTPFPKSVDFSLLFQDYHSNRCSGTSLRGLYLTEDVAANTSALVALNS